MSVQTVLDEVGAGVSIVLPREARSAGAARRLVTAALTGWRLTELVDPAVLVVTELVSNSVRHAAGESIRVTVARPAQDRARVSVIDFSVARPCLWAADPDEERGRGLELVDCLADAWGVDPLPPVGKRVWADLAGPAGARAPAGSVGES